MYIWGCPINCTDWCKSPKTVFANPFILYSSNAYKMAQDIESQKRHLCFMACVIVRLSRTHARIQIYRPRICTIRKKKINFSSSFQKYIIGPRCHPK